MFKTRSKLIKSGLRMGGHVWAVPMWKENRHFLTPYGARPSHFSKLNPSARPSTPTWRTVPFCEKIEFWEWEKLEKLIDTKG